MLLKQFLVLLRSTLSMKKICNKQVAKKVSVMDELEKLEKIVKQQKAEINNLGDQIIALRQTVAGLNQRTAGLMVYGSIFK
jgi:hypothetical protein